ncbi:MAG TPA: GNAT family N-acetyltransferase [Anaerolineales bacterium]|nr:GNAT family N-acetyltransferase [Anaerolineales bacterium]
MTNDHNQTLTLVSPSINWEQQYQEMVREFMETDEPIFNNFPLALENFAEFIAELEDEAGGRNLPPDISPQNTYWAVTRDEIIVDEICLRPTIPPPFELQSGHIGYNIHPSERRKGYATQQLSLVLDEARKYELKRVMLPVSKGNIGSERAIQKNGGYVDGQSEDNETGEVTLHYWINL